MIKRIWHGWTTPENAPRYENLLKTEIFPAIAARSIPGYRAIELLRREHDGEIEFITIMTFDSVEAVRKFAGEDYTVSYVPPKARELLARRDLHSQHYDVVESRTCD